MSDILINGGRKLSGEINTQPSKNGFLAVLSTALLNRGTTKIKNIPDIEDAKNLIKIVKNIGVDIQEFDNYILVKTPEKFNTDNINFELFSNMRCSIMLIPPIFHRNGDYCIPKTGGCEMGKRSKIAHVAGLKKLGIKMVERDDCIFITKDKILNDDVIISEMSDTASINILNSAALLNKDINVSFLSTNYQVQEVCFMLEKLGVQIDGIGTHKLCIHGVDSICKDIEYSNSEDPIEAMFFVSLALTTDSELLIKRVPIEFLSLELEVLKLMGLNCQIVNKYISENTKTKLVDIFIKKSNMKAHSDKIHSIPYPGINTDNLPFFVPIATKSEGSTLIHDWMWEKRAEYYKELNKLNACIELLDQHRVVVKGVCDLKSATLTCPPALRPSAVILIGMLAANGESKLLNTNPIQRGYGDIVNRLNSIGASIKII